MSLLFTPVPGRTPCQSGEKTPRRRDVTPRHGSRSAVPKRSPASVVTVSYIYSFLPLGEEGNPRDRVPPSLDDYRVLEVVPYRPKSLDLQDQSLLLPLFPDVIFVRPTKKHSVEVTQPPGSFWDQWSLRGLILPLSVFSYSRLFLL